MVRSRKKKSILKTGGKALQNPDLAVTQTPSSSSATPPIGEQFVDHSMSPDDANSYHHTKADPRPMKRLKTNNGSAIPSVSVQPPTLATNSIRTDLAPSLFPIPIEIQHLQDQYDISTISIISSSKIQQKVKNLIARVERFTFANVSAKPGVVVLHAKAASASKLISVIEIAKKDIEIRGGKWYQYSKLHSELLDFKEKQRKPSQDGRTLAGTTSGPSPTADGKTRPQRTDAGDQNDLAEEGVGSDAEVAFETLQHQSSSAASNGTSKVRATPIMTVYFACVSVPGLKDLFG
ncbi:MAG: hypothetical protein LQ337_006407 [Flavoplaca oasis]|nr:MAG: hypothetical protein LQ337_006407 [Flavoplaca oasis]